MESQSGLADWLDSLGYCTKGKRRTEIFGEMVEIDGRRFTRWGIRDILNNPFFAGKVRYKGEVLDGKHQAIISQELFDAVQEQLQKNRSRRSSNSNHNSENTHLLRRLVCCHECGTVFWAQNQGSMKETFYKSPDKGHDLICKYKGRSFLGRAFDAQMNQLFFGFELRDDWIVDRHIDGSDIQAALEERGSIEDRKERARQLLLDGDIDRQRYLRIRDEAEKALLSLYIPGYDDAVEAGKMLRDFGSLWQSSLVARRNGMARAMLHAVYVNP